jgi:hypothetical protein
MDLLIDCKNAHASDFLGLLSVAPLAEDPVVSVICCTLLKAHAPGSMLDCLAILMIWDQEEPQVKFEI